MAHRRGESIAEIIPAEPLNLRLGELKHIGEQIVLAPAERRPEIRNVAMAKVKGDENDDGVIDSWESTFGAEDISDDDRRGRIAHLTREQQKELAHGNHATIAQLISFGGVALGICMLNIAAATPGIGWGLIIVGAGVHAIYGFFEHRRHSLIKQHGDQIAYHQRKLKGKK